MEKKERYTEIVEIKDRLYADLQRLYDLLGRDIASQNVTQILSELGYTFKSQADIENSWRKDPDRMGGQFADFEIDRY